MKSCPFRLRFFELSQRSKPLTVLHNKLFGETGGSTILRIITIDFAWEREAQAVQVGFEPTRGVFGCQSGMASKDNMGHCVPNLILALV